jgi:hypothetical protein
MTLDDPVDYFNQNFIEKNCRIPSSERRVLMKLKKFAASAAEWGLPFPGAPGYS